MRLSLPMSCFFELYESYTAGLFVGREEEKEIRGKRAFSGESALFAVEKQPFARKYLVSCRKVLTFYSFGIFFQRLPHYCS
jgi:hypothetical protein